MSNSSIEWTEITWNPTTGCDKISAGCKYCYAEIMSNRLKSMKVRKYSKGFEIQVHPDTLNLPYEWKKPKIIFVNSMSDLFHEKISLSYIKQVFQVMNDNLQHTFQILTKRSDLLLKYNPDLNWSDNIWMGVSVENKDVQYRIDHLRKTNAKIKFLSIEPLLGPLYELNLQNIDWVIVGGESGHNPRPMKQEWVIDIRDQCKSSHVAFFFKQWGGKNKKLNGRLLEGYTYDEMPKSIILK